MTEARKPNVILILTDDQGYADLGCTGNPWLKTPAIDSFHDDAVFCSDFHVQPLCTPSRGAIMTGHRPMRNGAWATCWGRSLLGRDETTMADAFAAGGYRTGMFGKWHLGDNYPYRPFDRGFEHVVAHKGGGVGQTPDFWGNSYFDDTYFHNGKPVEHTGYCTDVWFDQAMRFIDGCLPAPQAARQTGDDKPFFCYLATNAPHHPYLVADGDKAPYVGNPDIVEPAFYGMIANIDDNFARLRKFLAERGIEDDTILIFMTDNGSSGGSRLDGDGFLAAGYNAGMRGKKGSYYDGGHRVPFFVRWPAGGMTGGREVTEMGLDVDLLPTFVDLCGLPEPEGVDFDGTSVAPLLLGEADALPGDRIHFLQYNQATDPPERWRGAALTRRWRLIGGEELYDIKGDPEQRRDVAKEHPEVVARLRDAFAAWRAGVEPAMNDLSPIVLGDDAENPTRLDAMDVMGDVAWHQKHIVSASKSTGRWTVDIVRPGRYRFGLRRWPEELGLSLDAGISPEEASKHIMGPKASVGECVVISPVEARVGLFGEDHVQPVAPDAKEVTFEIDIDRAGVTTLDAWFRDKDGEERGAYYVYVERLS